MSLQLSHALRAKSSKRVSGQMIPDGAIRSISASTPRKDTMRTRVHAAVTSHVTPDKVFAVGSALLTVALIPSILGDDKPALWTSLPTAAVLASFTLTYASIRFRYAATVSALTTICWGILAIQVL